MRGYVNALPALEKLGADPIRLTIDWCRKNKKEIVIALPVNPRTHGNRPTSERGIGSWHAYLWPAFKTKNPDALIEGTTEVDYGNAKVRDKLVAIASEIVGKYDVDGLMIDFMDVPRLFGSVVAGGVAEPKEAAALTQMMQKIASACRSASARLGHDGRLALGRVRVRRPAAQELGRGLLRDEGHPALHPRPHADHPINFRLSTPSPRLFMV